MDDRPVDNRVRVRLDEQLVNDLPSEEAFRSVVSTIHNAADFLVATASPEPSAPPQAAGGTAGATTERTKLRFFRRLLVLRGAELLRDSVGAMNESRLVSFALAARALLETAAVAVYHAERLGIDDGATSLPGDYNDRLRAAVLAGKFDWRKFLADPASRLALIDAYDADFKKQQPPDAAKSVVVMVDELGVRLGKVVPKGRGRVHFDYALLSDMCHPSAGSNLIYLAEADPSLRAELLPQRVTLLGIATVLLPCVAYSAHTLVDVLGELDGLADRLGTPALASPPDSPADAGHE